MAAKQNWNYKYYKVVYCNHKGEWITIYVRGGGFTWVYKYMKDKPEMFLIRTITWELENGELMDKFIEGQDLAEPIILYPTEPTDKQTERKQK